MHRNILSEADDNGKIKTPVFTDESEEVAHNEADHGKVIVLIKQHSSDNKAALKPSLSIASTSEEYFVPSSHNVNEEETDSDSDTPRKEGVSISSLKVKPNSRLQVKVPLSYTKPALMNVHVTEQQLLIPHKQDSETTHNAVVAFSKQHSLVEDGSNANGMHEAQSLTDASHIQPIVLVKEVAGINVPVFNNVIKPPTVDLNDEHLLPAGVSIKPTTLWQKLKSNALPGSTLTQDALASHHHVDRNNLDILAHHEDMNAEPVTHHDDVDVHSHNYDMNADPVTHHDDADIVVHHDGTLIDSHREGMNIEFASHHHDGLNVDPVTHHDDVDVLSHHYDMNAEPVTHHDDVDVHSHHYDMNADPVTHHDDADIVVHHDGTLIDSHREGMNIEFASHQHDDMNVDPVSHHEDVIVDHPTHHEDVDVVAHHDGTFVDSTAHHEDMNFEVLDHHDGANMEPHHDAINADEGSIHGGINLVDRLDHLDNLDHLDHEHQDHQDHLDHLDNGHMDHAHLNHIDDLNDMEVEHHHLNGEHLEVEHHGLGLKPIHINQHRIVTVKDEAEKERMVNGLVADVGKI